MRAKTSGKSWQADANIDHLYTKTRLSADYRNACVCYDSSDVSRHAGVT